MERKKASDYPQELLDLFHEYQHGDISRRAFLDRAGAVHAARDITGPSTRGENTPWRMSAPQVTGGS